MNKIKKGFSEFKSVFVTEDLLKENEEHANVVVSTTMTMLFIVVVIVCILTHVGLFKVNKAFMIDSTIRSIFTLFIPSTVGLILKGRGKYLKYVLIVCLTISIGTIYALLTYTAILLLIIPILLAARYYSKKFTIFVAIISIIMIGIVEYMGIYVGLLDLNYVPLPNGTTITIDTNILDAVKKLNLDYGEITKFVMLNSYLPKIFVYIFTITFASVQISRSGKNMIEKQKEITKKGARIETELNLANAIQKNMLPSIFPPFPEHREFDIYASMFPAKEVGGDFYDMFLIDDNHLAICMAAVSGKGVPASLFMMISKILIKNISCIDKETDIALTRVNNMLCDGNKLGLFVTAWFGILDLKNGNLEFVNAGHNPPLLYSRKTGKFEYLRTKPNLLLAWKENVNYIKNEIQLEPGDRIFLYTDGVTEATNSENKLYREERLQDFLNNNLNLNAEETIKALKENLDKFVGNVEQFDDITMLEFCFKGNENEKDNIIQKEFKADGKELPKIQEFAKTELEKYNCDPKTIKKIDLVIEEIFANIANYAYKDKKGNCILKIQFDQECKVDLIFEDSGIPFNPLEKQEPDFNLPLKERGIGGLGIFLTRKMIDDIQYKYENNKNILKITKFI